jgi:hypothetical protein
LALIWLYFYRFRPRKNYQEPASASEILGTKIGPVRFPGQTSRARQSRKRGGTVMWLSLFSIVTAIALACGLAAVVLESYEEARP